MSVILILKLLFLFILFGMSLSLFQYIERNKVIETSVKTIYTKVQSSENMRTAREKRLILEEGAGKRKSIFYKLDLLIVSSGLRRRVPFLNTEVMMICSLLLGIAFGVLSFMMTHLWVACISISLGGVLSPYLILYLMSVINYNKVENSLLEFANLLENYSRTSDDIVSIMGHVAKDIGEPLKTALQEFQRDSVAYGVARAFELLQSKIDHELFKEIIRYIEIGAGHEANYIEIIKGNREVLRSYYSIRQERKAILDNGKREIGILLLVFGAMLYVLKDLLSIDLFHLLITTLAGNLIIIYCIGVMGFCVYKLISLGKGR